MENKTELIVNADGSVYHLHLLPYQVAPVIITVGDPGRVEMVSRHFDSIRLKMQNREFVTHTGIFNGREITVLSTGIGTDNIDIALNEINFLLNYDHGQNEFRENKIKAKIIRIGTSGCIQPGIPVDSLLTSRYAIGLDNLMHFYTCIPGEDEIRLLTHFNSGSKLPPAIIPYAATPSNELFSHFENGFQKGITITSPGFYAPQGRGGDKKFNPRDFMDFSFNGLSLTNIEMETAGIYGLGKLFGFECISLNALLANRATGEFSKDPAKTIALLIENVMEVIKRID